MGVPAAANPADSNGFGCGGRCPASEIAWICEVFPTGGEHLANPRDLGSRTPAAAAETVAVCWVRRRRYSHATARVAKTGRKVQPFLSGKNRDPAGTKRVNSEQ